MGFGRTWLRILCLSALALILLACTQQGAPFFRSQNGTGMPQAFDRGGGVLPTVEVQLIFWGHDWTTPMATYPAVIDSVTNLLSGPYMSALDQYGIKGGTLRGITLDTTSEPKNPYSTPDVRNEIQRLIISGNVPPPTPNLLYVFMMPSTSTHSQSEEGEHSYFAHFDPQALTPSPPTFVNFAWVAGNIDLDVIDQTFAHELVEAATDPHGNGWGVFTSSTFIFPNWQEIGDICAAGDLFPKGARDRVNGVLVSFYWSVRDKTCVIPTGHGQMLLSPPGE